MTFGELVERLWDLFAVLGVIALMILAGGVGRRRVRLSV